MFFVALPVLDRALPSPFGEIAPSWWVGFWMDRSLDSRRFPADYRLMVQYVSKLEFERATQIRQIEISWLFIANRLERRMAATTIGAMANR
jgi:hypothetical protein